MTKSKSHVTPDAWPFPTTSRPAEPTIDFKQMKETEVRKEYTLTDEQYATLIEASQHIGTDDTKLHLFWAALGSEQSFKWWTVSPNLADYRKFSAEVLNEPEKS